MARTASATRRLFEYFMSISRECGPRPMDVFSVPIRGPRTSRNRTSHPAREGVVVVCEPGHDDVETARAPGRVHGPQAGVPGRFWLCIG